VCNHKGGACGKHTVRMVISYLLLCRSPGPRELRAPQNGIQQCVGAIVYETFWNNQLAAEYTIISNIIHKRNFQFKKVMKKLI
jgi:hypothetical protein